MPRIVDDIGSEANGIPGFDVQRILPWDKCCGLQYYQAIAGRAIFRVMRFGIFKIRKRIAADGAVAAIDHENGGRSAAGAYIAIAICIIEGKKSGIRKKTRFYRIGGER